MSVYSDLAAALNDAAKARSWFRELVACHSEIVTDAEKHEQAAYPFFTFLCSNDLTLLAIFHSEENVMLVGIEISDREMIEKGHQMAMKDVKQMEEFLGENSQLIRFGETVTLAGLSESSA